MSAQMAHCRHRLRMLIYSTTGLMKSCRLSTSLLLLAYLLPCASGQTTQGLISGHLVDSVTGRPVAEAAVAATSDSGAEARAESDADGYYYLPLLSPASYRIRVTAPNYQSQEVQEVTLPVAGRLEFNFRLRPLSDVWESGQYNSVFLPGSKTIVTFFGPDVDPTLSGTFEAQKGRTGALESTVSEVIDSQELEGLPLQGRDVYALLVTQPGVTSDAATGRGLGLSANGQRPSASNYLLDGVENNNYLITGPLVTVAPEAIQEYRVSVNNFSAEYGRTSGFLANAITRSGSNQFHGTGYLYLENDILNANAFQDNLYGIARVPQKQVQPGFVVGGPVLHNRLYFSSSYEHLHSASFAAPVSITVPAPALLDFAIPGRDSRTLLDEYPPPPVASNGLTGTLTVTPPVVEDRALAIERGDWNSSGGRDRVMGRLLISRQTRPDFIWTPYPDFISPLHENTWALGGSYTRLLQPNLTNEARLSFSSDNLYWDRAHPEIPTLGTGDGVVLPGSLAAYSYRNLNRSWEMLDNLIWARGRHLITVGAGLLLRNSDGYLTAGRDGFYQFNNILYFALDQPSYVLGAMQRLALPNVVQPSYGRTYGYRQYFAFAQDSYKLTSRLTVNYGLRYENFGGPSNIGTTKDVLIQLGPGANLAQQLTGAQLTLPGPGNQRLFNADNGDWAIRSGASYDLTGTARTLLRGGFGIYYDRPFDNLWENLRTNDLTIPTLPLSGQTDFLAPISTVLSQFSGQVTASDFPDMTLVDPNLKNGRVYTYFAGIQQNVTNNLTVEVNGLGSYGRRLVTTDVINRDFSTATGPYNPNLPNIAYRAGQGFSDYNALAAVVRYRGSRGMVQGTYTWSHTIDNQSDPLVGDFFNLSFTGLQGPITPPGRSAFSVQFNPNVDRGNAAFDQRQNLVLFGYWNPAPVFEGSKVAPLFREWNLGALTAFRSGFPYNLVGTSTAIPGQGEILNNRPNLVDPAAAQINQPVPGGVQLLNAAAFQNAAPSTLGNVGRNVFIGPGFYNLDLSLGRSFALPWLGESGRLNFRADAFNVLNHANLGNPDTLLTSPTFGIATYGRQSTASSGFPAVSPLNETPRQVQLSVRVEF
jgi:Carboxypeptidase regulatory-like domain/TonB-dependent Receptor Plug Domain